MHNDSRSTYLPAKGLSSYAKAFFFNKVYIRPYDSNLDFRPPPLALLPD